MSKQSEAWKPDTTQISDQPRQPASLDEAGGVLPIGGKIITGAPLDAVAVAWGDQIIVLQIGAAPLLINPDGSSRSLGEGVA